MRWAALILVLPMGACSTVEPIPTPWDPSETQLAEPSQPTEAAAPGWTRIGSSIRGKPIEAATVGSGPRRIYIIGGVHGDEPEGPAAAAGLPGALLREFISEAGERATVRIVRDVNPDGTALGTRGNTRGIDLNRNWPSKDFRAEGIPGSNAGRRAGSELEVSAVRQDLAAFKPELVVVFGTASTGRGPEVGYIGRSPLPAYDFSAAARKGDAHWRVNATARVATPGSVESWVGTDIGRTVLLVEFRRGSEAAANLRSVAAGVVALATGGAPRPPRASKAADATKPEAPIRAPVLGGR
jgi:murein peptide amidase A